MDLLSNNVKQAQKAYRTLKNDTVNVEEERRKADKMLQPRSDAEKFKSGEATYVRMKRIRDAFRKNAKAVQADGRRGTLTAQNLNLHAADLVYTEEERTALATRRADGENNYVTEFDERLGKALEADRQHEKDRFKRVEDAMCAQYLQEKEQLKDKLKDRKNRKDADRERDRELDRLISNVHYKVRDAKTLDCFLTDDDEANRTLVERWLSGREQKHEIMTQLAEEVLTYNFSLAMLDPKWLGNNMTTFHTMVSRTFAINTLLNEEKDFKKIMPYDTWKALDLKKKQANELTYAIDFEARKRGVNLNYRTSSYSVKRFSEEEKNKYPALNKDKTAESCIKKFISFKKNELDLSGKVTTHRDSDDAAVNSLTYMDFVAMIGTMNRGQVTLSRGKLTVINNGYFCRKKGDVSEVNYAIKQRFMAVILDQLNTTDDEKLFRPKLTAMLHLYDKDEQACRPITRKLIREILAEVGQYNSKLEKSLKKGEKAENNNEPEVKIARKVEELIPGVVGGIPTSKPDRRRISMAISSILREARGLGVAGRDLTTHQMDNILNGNLSLLRDNIFRRLIELDKLILNIKAGEDLDPDGWLADNTVVKKIAALEIRRIAESGGDGVLTREKELSVFLGDKAFELAGKQDLKNDFESLYISSISADGDQGLMELLENRKSTIPDYDTPAFKKKAGDFAMLLNRIQRISLINGNWLSRTSNQTKVSATEMKELGKLIDDELIGDEKYADLFDALRGTRFLEGYQQVRVKVTQGFRFETAANTLAAKLSSDRKTRKILASDAEELEVRRTQLSEADQAAYDSLGEKEKKIADIFLLKAEASSLIEAPMDDNSKMLFYIRNVLNSYSVTTPFVMTIPLAKMRLEQKKNGTLYLISGRNKLMLPLSSKRIKDQLDMDMASHIDKYGQEEVYENIISTTSEDDSEWEKVRTRDLCIKILEQLTGKKAAFFSNCRYSDVKSYVMKLIRLDGDIFEQEKQNILGLVAEIDNKKIFNDAETLTFSEKDKAFRLKKTDVELPMEEDRKFNADEPQWTEEEKAVKDLIADCVFSTESWLKDKEYRQGGAKRGSRLMSVLETNEKALMAILDDEKIIDRTMDKMAFPEVKTKQKEGEPPKESFKERLKKDIRKIFEDKAIKDLQKSKKEGVSDESIRLSFGITLQRKKENGELEAIEKKIDEDVIEITDSMQDEIAHTAEEAFKDAEIHVEVTNIADPYNKELTREQQDKALKDRSDELNARIDQEYRGDAGQGNFIKTVLKEYFKASDDIDKRSMVGAMLRGSVPKKNMEGMTEDEKKAEETRIKGNTLGGFFRGAGPLLQKMLQGLPEQGLPEVMKIALADVKSNLDPIHEVVVRQRLDYLIKRSKGAVTRIEVTKPLGAASVGQAFLCRMYGPDLPATGKEVVVKLLRPDAKNRMNRERGIILLSADHADPGGAMRHTYEGQLNKIEEEFDLSIEEKNARAGEIYNKGDSSVKSVAMENMLQVTGNTLVLEKAEGTTVDSYMKETDAIRENALSVFYQYDNKKVITDPETGRPILSSKPGQQADIAKARKALEKRLIALEKRQGFLAVTAEKWVTEGIFGRGFYHGDLHAGNIMISENGATIIDYGNAVQLNQTQQKEITRLVAAVSVGDVDGFIQAFHALLENTPPQTWEQKKDELRAEVQKVFNIGAKELSGQMISLILMRASSIGLEIPAAINNFSQSQIRLQNTIDSVNDVIRSIRKDIEELDRLGADQAAFDVTLLMQKEYLTEGKDQDETIKEYRKKISTDDLEIYREIRIKGRNNRRRFDEDRMNLLKDGDKKTAAVEALEELRRAQDAKRGNLVQLEDEFVKAYRAAFRESRLQSDLATDLRNKLRSDDEQLKATMDKELELYFEGEEGEKLRTTYEAYRRARSENAGEEEIRKIEDMFLDKYLGMVAVRLDEISEQRRVRNRRIKSFYKIMGEVTNRNLTASLDRLGFFTAYSYKKTLGRKKMKPSPGEVVVGQQVNEEDVRRLGAIENVENHMPVVMPQTILTVMDEKEQKIVIEARLSEIDEVYKKAVRENKRYEKEKGAAKETEKSKQALKAVTIKQIWTGIYDENIKDKGFFIKSDTKKEGDKRAFDVYFDALNKAFEKDFARIQSGGDFLNSQEVEEELHKLLVDMPKAHGGEQFFMDIMNGECRSGGKYDGLAKTKIKDKDTSSIVATLNSFAAGRYNFEGNEDIKRYVAKTLMIFGEKWERSFALRHKDYESQDRELKRERETIEERRNERFSRDYGYWLGTLKNSKETRKRYLAAGKPVLKDEYKGDKGEAAFLAKIKENGWTFPGDDDIMRSFYRLTMIDCEKGAGKGADPKRVAEYADVLRTMLADITETRADTQKMREDILYQIRRCVKEYGNTDSHDLDDDTNYIDRFKALGIIGKIAHSKRMIQGPLSYWRVRSGRLGYEPKRAHNEKQLLEKMYYNDWLEDDKPLAQALLSLLLKAYESEAQSKTDEEKAEAKRVIECIEPVLTAFETEQLYTAKRRGEVLGGLGTLFGDKKDLFGIASDTIMPLVSRELTKEEKDRLERYEKRRVDEEQKRRSEDRLDKMSLENGQIPRNKIYREGKEREKREQELYPDNKFWHVKNKNITRQEWENACDRYGEKGGFENLYKAYTFMYDKASTVLYKEASDEAKAKTILKKAKYSEDFTEKFVDRFFLKGKNESEVADMMMLLLAMNLTKTDRLAGRVEDSEWLPNLQSRTLDGIEMLIELDRGNNAHADEWDIRGVGVLSEEDREELLELVSEERRRLSLSEDERERFDKRRAEEKQRRIEYEKKRAEKEKERAEKEKNRLKEAEEKKWQKIADAEMAKLKARGIKIENVKDSSIKIMTKDALKDCRKTEYTDEPGDQFSDYGYLSYDEMEKMAAVNHYNNTDDPEFKTLYGSLIVKDKESNKAKVVAYDGDSPFIRHSNGAFVNAFVRARNSDKPYNNMYNVYKQGKEFTGAKVRNDEDAWEKANEHTVETLDKATQINELPKDCRLVRMVNGDFLKYGLGLKDVITGKKGPINSDELVESINKKAGSVIKNECFTSTSAGIDRQFDGRPVMLTILADKGTKCMMTANYDECDVILGRDKRFALVGAYAHGEKGKMVRRTNIRETYEKKEGKAGKSLDFRGLEIVVKLLNDKEG